MKKPKIEILNANLFNKAVLQENRTFCIKFYFRVIFNINKTTNSQAYASDKQKPCTKSYLTLYVCIKTHTFVLDYQFTCIMQSAINVIKVINLINLTYW